MSYILYASSPAYLKLTGDGDLESEWTATVFPTWHPTAKLLCEYFLELANFLRFGWHWVPDMNVYAITSCPVMTPLWCPPLLEKCVPIVVSEDHTHIRTLPLSLLSTPVSPSHVSSPLKFTKQCSLCEIFTSQLISLSTVHCVHWVHLVPPGVQDSVVAHVMSP